MDQAPAGATRVSQERLRQFVVDASLKIGFPEHHSNLLGQVLVDNDLRGVWTHGSWLMGRYRGEAARDGINVRPQITTVSETPTSLLLDGDGGMGYFPMHEGTLRVIEKAKQSGIAILCTRNHAHFGAAAIYARITLEHDLLTFVTSGAQMYLAEGNSILSAGGGSPMCFSAPTSTEYPVVHDCGVMHDTHQADRRKWFMENAPGILHRALGFGTFCQSWGGLLAGLQADYQKVNRVRKDANQGALLITFKISLFADPEQFKREMDEYVRLVRERLTPVKGNESFLPGGYEAHLLKEYSAEGIPLKPEHQNTLQKLCDELAVTPPWQ